MVWDMALGEGFITLPVPETFPQFQSVELCMHELDFLLGSTEAAPMSACVMRNALPEGNGCV